MNRFVSTARGTLRCLIWLVALACAPVWAGTAAEVVFVAGAVEAGTPGRALKAGDHVQEDERLATGIDGYLYLRTADRGFLILRPASEARIVRYHYDPARPQETRARIELVRGVARAVSGEGVRQAKEHFRFNTPVAAIGIRGTDFSVFTDASVSRVSVRSGAIVMSGFGADCSPGGSGPCRDAVELSAHTPETILQIRSGQLRPERLDASGQPQLAPDQVAPPLIDELVGKAAAHPIAERGTLSAALLPSDSAPPTNAPRQINWGRWQAIAGLPANFKLNDAMLADGSLVSRLPVFALVRGAGVPGMLPREGAATFRLRDHEGYFVSSGGAVLEGANASQGQLAIDFATRRFETALHLAGATQQTRIQASGSISDSGLMSSDFMKSNSYVRGALAGANGGEAGYLYQRPVSDTVSAVGATYWTR
ncbi:FecR family protein [Thauera aromatica]|uniref:FecR family protein n=1 Tax=Thauera aromatica TaxID=59405 RepID=UPI001FFC735B|nr:FecR domain-containing protein [Thauera aromatica]MCK2097396.1 FecR family protein [Thauera aromatica]